MAKSKLEKLIEQFDSGDYDIDSFKEVDVSVGKSAKSIFLVPIESSIYREVSRISKEKRTTVEKLINALLKKSVLKTA
jgi:hypothetical protein